MTGFASCVGTRFHGSGVGPPQTFFAKDSPVATNEPNGDDARKLPCASVFSFAPRERSASMDRKAPTKKFKAIRRDKKAG
jgi:hypothetical protein